MTGTRPGFGRKLSVDSVAGVRYIASRKQFDFGETGYWSIQGTKPQTLAYAQQDSPIGLIAWMLEKFWAWTMSQSSSRHCVHRTISGGGTLLLRH